MLNKVTMMVDIKKLEWIADVLTNDENDSDEALLDYFMKEGSMTREEAASYVDQRDKFLGKVASVEDLIPYSKGEKMAVQKQDKLYALQGYGAPNDLKDRMVSTWLALEICYQHLKLDSNAELLEAYWFFKGAQANLYASIKICENIEACKPQLSLLSSARNQIDRNADEMGEFLYKAGHNANSYGAAALRFKFFPILENFQKLIADEIQTLSHEGLI